MPESQIFKATYSGIPVYEMMCKGVAVMRRRADSWLNATQILKVAGFDKPQRTRVLEREVQKGEHEKVQGGYGKYQGTWIPMERGLALAKQYNCDTVLRPIIEFQETSKSPPLAPKHVAASAGSVASRAASSRRGDTGSMTTRSSRRQVADASEVGTELDSISVVGTEDGSMTPSPSGSSASSRTPSPIRESPGTSKHTDGKPQGSTRHTKHRRKISMVEEQANNNDKSPRMNGMAKDYAEEILEYFISDSNQVPDILVHPPADFDPNLAIDDDGHTPLHWACAMGRIRILKLLLSAGADTFSINKSGQTALMRSVMFSNNYDVRKFPELYELLHKSTLNIDNYNRTVFHHIVDLAMSKGKTHASRYYMETVITRLADFPRELADVINFQDEDGETALTLAARCRSKRLVKILIDNGADPKIVNNDGKSAEDYILEDERFRASPGPPARVYNTSYRNVHNVHPQPGPGGINFAFQPLHSDRPGFYHSATAQKTSTRCVNDMTSMLDSLATSFDSELRDKDKDIAQAHALLGNIQAEILESQRAVGHIKAQAEALPPTKAKLNQLEEELLLQLGRRYRTGWERWIKEEEAREDRIRAAAGGQLQLTAVTATFLVEEEQSDPGPPSTSSQHFPPEQIADKQHQQGPHSQLEPKHESDKALGKRKASPTPYSEDISDLLSLYSNIPTDPQGMHEACKALREEITQQRKRRKQEFDNLVSCKAEIGTSARMSEYRKLIGAGCGGISGDEVDNVVASLLESLEEEEPSSSSAWVG